jgi:homoserine kinase type II
LLKSYLSGQVIDPLPLETMFPLGQAMARLHQVPPPVFLPDQLAYGRETFGPMRQKIGRPHPFLDWLNMIEEHLQNHLPKDLPRALIHADIFADNVILTPDQGPVIMDFEEAATYYRVFDLGMAIVGTCYPEGELNSRSREALLRGYKSVISLSEAEERALNAATVYAAAAMASWRFWHFNVVQPGAGKQEHYRALQKIADDLLAKTTEG